MRLNKKISDNEVKYLYLKDKNAGKTPTLPLTEFTDFPFDDIFLNDYKIVVTQYKVKETINRFVRANVFEYMHVVSVILQDDRTVLITFAKGNSQKIDWDKKERKRINTPHLVARKKKRDAILEYIEEEKE